MADAGAAVNRNDVERADDISEAIDAITRTESVMSSHGNEAITAVCIDAITHRVITIGEAAEPSDRRESARLASLLTSRTLFIASRGQAVQYVPTALRPWLPLGNALRCRPIGSRVGLALREHAAGTHLVARAGFELPACGLWAVGIQALVVGRSGVGAAAN
jgi:hypothetical protein